MPRAAMKRRGLQSPEKLEPRLLLAAAPIITEFMASNDAGLADGNGAFNDWIEIFNAGDEALDLAGWHLTDNHDNLNKWSFPRQVLDAGEHLVVFASGQGGIDRGGRLHTDFKLSALGEYLALVEPDGRTIVSEFASGGRDYRAQTTDISYGVLEIEGGLIATGFFTTPTPGEANVGPIVGHGPDIRDVRHQPAEPVAGEDLIVTARIEPTLHAVDTVTLRYLLMFGRPISVPMFDDGAHGDGEAGDGVYGGVVPTRAGQEGMMLRYNVEALDTAGIGNETPLLLKFSGMDRSPQYFGTVVADPAAESNLPVFHWFTRDPAAAGTRAGTRASIYYDGEFYDNVFVRLRGGSTATGGPVGKPHYKFDFPGAVFRFSPEFPRVEEFNLNATASDKAYIRQPLSFETYDAVGSPGSISFPMHVRRNGAFNGVFAFIEQPDEEMLAREGLDPDGALYKMFNEFTSGGGSVEKKTRRDENNADLISFVSNVNTLNGDALRNYLFDNVDLPRTLNYLVATVLVHQNDNPHKNHYLYRDTNGTGEWFFLPWDHDLTWGSNWVGTSFSDVIYADNDFLQPGSGPIPGHNLSLIAPSHPFVNASPYREWNNHWNRLMDELLNEPTIREMYLRRLRSTMDQILGDPDTPAENRWVDRRLDEYLALMSDDAALDFDEWADPWRWGANQNFQQAVDVIRNDYLPRRRTHLYETHLIGNRNGAGIPLTQSARPQINFGAIDFAPASGNQDEEFIELTNPNATAIDLSGWRLIGGVEYTIRPGTVIPAGGSLYLTPDAATFRARAEGPRGGQGLFVQDGYRGHISSFGESITLVDEGANIISTIVTPGMPSDVQRYLRITEIHYNPAGSDDTEFLELKNISDAVTLNLSGVRFTQGFSQDFDFTTSDVTSLAPGAYALIVKDRAAFRAAYPQVDPGMIAGVFSGSLDNSGETIKLEDGLNGTVLEFRYEDGNAPGEESWHPTTDGDGFSLVILDPLAGPSTWGSGHAWGASSHPGGSPGAADLVSTPRQIGDATGDGVVDLDDLNAVRNNFGAAGSPGTVRGDAYLGTGRGFDGRVDLDDLNAVRNNFGARAVAAPPLAVVNALGDRTTTAGLPAASPVAETTQPQADVSAAPQPVQAPFGSSRGDKPAAVNLALATWSSDPLVAPAARPAAEHLQRRRLRSAAVDHVLVGAYITPNKADRQALRTARSSRGHLLKAAQPLAAWEQAVDALMPRF